MKEVRDIIIKTDNMVDKIRRTRTLRDDKIREIIYKMLFESNRKYCDLSDDEKELFAAIYLLAETEHKRWNAYMRSEGWCFGKRKQSNLKYHNNLVPFHELTLENISNDL